MAVAVAAPNGPNNLEVLKSERMKPIAGASVPAQAGNVTELNINATSVTKSWQGYFGNISGVITLDNANNMTMYNWVDASPQGEVYASPAQISSWASVKCINFSAHSPELNLSNLESSLGMRTADVDGVNETFRYSFSGDFWVGSVHITSGNECPATYTFKNDAPQSVDFVEVLLTDSTDVIYASILEDSVAGFDEKPHDFQMLVGENGHNGDVAVTQYYFYVELE
ncbi:MAG: hypothetical protein V1837_02695 [Candidatus Woesearchaeota archaeon]